MGRYEAAAAQYREALRSKPGSAEIYNNLGVSLLGLGRAEEAVTNFEDAMRLKPDFAGAHFNLGNVLQGMGRNYDAVAQYREALRYDPASVDAHNNLGVPSWGSVALKKRWCNSTMLCDSSRTTQMRAPTSTEPPCY